MAYSIDYKKRAVEYKDQGHTAGNLLPVEGKAGKRVL
jgi:hypothetical protein